MHVPDADDDVENIYLGKDCHAAEKALREREEA
jgi:hypothetical protein